MNAARLPGARAPGHGLTLVTRLLGLSLATAVSGRVSGSVVVRQQVIEHGRKLGAPTQNSYVATLVREAGEWKVSEYTLIP